ncbi:YfiR family protein [Enterobacter sp. 04-C-01-SI_S15]|uniref:YfiR family protein n=1 Tax=Enterobacter rongchengensis TaxID=3030999 RepID=A0ABV4JIB4_9ENTR|nr:MULTISPECIES: YfiR family protein [Enterobacter]MCK7281247.1 YfiR family protein [Enterobacter chengduensis]MCM7426735.1 YfiR family protein [Enterobacter chengduensis]MDL0066637.1 YfiR family protein [Enterobacter chengduensis]MDY0421169.1 YfiR family protein [Enterobacter sp. 170250]
MWRILVRNLFLISFFRLTLVLMLFLIVGPTTAGTLTETDKSVRSIVSGIVSYTRWPTLSGHPKLCVYATSHYTHALIEDEGHSELPYTPVIVRNDREALAATCDAIYFGSESPAKQLELISQYQGRALLLISEQNPECVIGSAFCLIIDGGQVRFSVNLDALTRSGVRVNPDVLMLARNKQHG